MELKTKFNIGDKVHAIVQKVVKHRLKYFAIRGNITSVHKGIVSVDGKNVVTEYYRVDDVDDRYESETDPGVFFFEEYVVPVDLIFTSFSDLKKYTYKNEIDIYEYSNGKGNL